MVPITFGISWKMLPTTPLILTLNAYNQSVNCPKLDFYWSKYSDAKYETKIYYVA